MDVVYVEDSINIECNELNHYLKMDVVYMEDSINIDCNDLNHYFHTDILDEVSM
jgi:hypothetical protein